MLLIASTQIGFLRKLFICPPIFMVKRKKASKVMMMKTKTFAFAGILLVIISLVLIAGCNPKPVVTNNTNPLFNQSLNIELENLTNAAPVDSFIEFYFNYTQRNDSKYEIAEDDIFTLTNGDFTSKDISFLGIVLGDSYTFVLDEIGIPDVMFVPADASYRNMEYRKKIGIGGKFSGITYHLENDTVTSVTVKPPFIKYMKGNTTLGQSTELIYWLLDIPDYQSFLSSYRVFHYVEKGVNLYFKGNYVNMIEFTMPKKFKGVTYVTMLKATGDGVFVNVTEPVLNE